jgi:RNA 2',3'-cyclic 3'-phosphodiesterase
MDVIRAFIAIELPAEVKEGIRKTQAGLKSFNAQSAKWVDPDSIHLTLKFLGNVPVSKIETISRALEAAAEEGKPFQIEVQGLGVFPGLARPQVIWIGLKGQLDELQKLQQNVESRVSPLGYPTEKRPFTPHLTLARVRDTATAIERQKLSEIVVRTETGPGLTIYVNSVYLMRSQLTPSGAIYNQVAKIALKTS